MGTIYNLSVFRTERDKPSVSNYRLFTELLLYYEMMPMQIKGIFRINHELDNDITEITFSNKVVGIIEVHLPLNSEKFDKMNVREQIDFVLNSVIKGLTLVYESKRFEIKCQNFYARLQKLCTHNYLIQRYHFKTWKKSPNKLKYANLWVQYDAQIIKIYIEVRTNRNLPGKQWLAFQGRGDLPKFNYFYEAIQVFWESEHTVTALFRFEGKTIELEKDN